MDRRRVILGLMVSLTVHGLLILSLRIAVLSSSMLTVREPSVWVDYGEISLCEGPSLNETETAIDLKNLLADPLKEVAPPPSAEPPPFNPLPMPASPIVSSSSNDTQSSGAINTPSSGTAPPPSMGTNDTPSSSKNAPSSGRTANGASNPSSAVKKGVPLHGKVKAGKTIIYILDSSSSMADDDALSHAKRCLQASLMNLDETTKFQIIAYNSRAFSHSQEPILCTDRNRQEALAWLEKLTPQGSSHHQSGFESACWRRPDAIFLLTDADDLGPKELAVLSKIIPEDTYLNVTIFGESEPRGLLEKLTEPRGGTVRRYSQK